MEYTTNPITGKKIKTNRLVDSVQYGGHPILGALPTLSQLAIPAGLTLASYYGHKYIGKQKGGGNNNILYNPILQNWITENKIKKLYPTTLIPAGILVTVYNHYANLPHTKATIYKQISDIVNKNDIKKYMNQHNLRSLTPLSELPFAVLMGPDVFKQLILDEAENRV